MLLKGVVTPADTGKNLVEREAVRTRAFQVFALVSQLHGDSQTISVGFLVVFFFFLETDK